MQRIRGRRPRMIVCGLNPHAGENGIFGDEEGRLIVPAIEAARLQGAQIIGPLPPDVQHVTMFSCGIHAQAKETAAAKDLVKFLTGPNAKPVIEKAGLEPV